MSRDENENAESTHSAIEIESDKEDDRKSNSICELVEQLVFNYR